MKNTNISNFVIEKLLTKDDVIAMGEGDMFVLCDGEDEARGFSGMTYEQAIEMAKAAKETKLVSDVRVNQLGGEMALPTSPWEVEIWHVNPRSGNRNLHVMREYDMPNVPAHVRSAIGKARARDKAAFARIAAEKAMEME